MWGGGGGGAALQGGGGGAGGYVEGIITSPPSEITVTVGVGGTGGSGGNGPPIVSATNGTDSVFIDTNTLVATGGSAAPDPNSGQTIGGVGGTGYGSAMLFYVEGGWGQIPNQGMGSSESGVSGGNAGGGGGAGGIGGLRALSYPGRPGINPAGGGGAGCIDQSFNPMSGGNGGNGRVIIRY
jgi:hypothetical protein